AQARLYATSGAAAISVLTDQKYFRGALDDLVAVRAVVDVPLLRKEFILEEYQLWESRAAGADAVLLIVAALEDGALRDLHHAAKGIGLGTLVEVHTLPELERALAFGAPVIGVNNRNLHTLETSLEPSLALLPRIPGAHTAVSESGIFSRQDVEQVVRAGAQAVLVGEGLVRAQDVPAKVRELALLDDAAQRSARGRSGSRRAPSPALRARAAPSRRAPSAAAAASRTRARAPARRRPHPAASRPS